MVQVCIFVCVNVPIKPHCYSVMSENIKKKLARRNSLVKIFRARFSIQAVSFLFFWFCEAFPREITLNICTIFNDPESLLLGPEIYFGKLGDRPRLLR